MRELAIPTRVRADYAERGWWTDRRLIEHIERAARARGDVAAVVDESATVTYAEIWDLGSRLAGWLAARGVGEGAVVSVQLPNWWEFALLQVATEMLGAALNPLLPIYGEKELRHVVSTCESRILVVPERHRSRSDFVDTASQLLDGLSCLKNVLVVRGDGEARHADGIVALDEALKAESIAPVEGVSADSPALIAFTSGTESFAKGCVHTSNTTLYAQQASVGELGLTQDDIVFMPSPVGHATGINWGVRLAFFLETTVVLQDRWDASVACELIRSHGCTFSLSATPFVRELVDHVRDQCPSADFSRFRTLVSGGAPIPRELVAEVKTVLGADLLACFGQAETWMVSLVRPQDSIDVKAGSDGRLMPDIEVRVADDVGEEVAPGERGECLTRGPHVMLGYLNPPSGHDYEPGQWLPMGDYVVVDADGCLQVVGRKKEIIIRGGMNISPREVEEMLTAHPAVASVAVVGYPDPRLGERACAIVVPARGERPTLMSLTAHLRALGCASYKLPERLELIDELPRTPSGKLQKVKLKRWLEGEAGGAGRTPAAVSA